MLNNHLLIASFYHLLILVPKCCDRDLIYLIWNYYKLLSLFNDYFTFVNFKWSEMINRKLQGEKKQIYKQANLHLAALGLLHRTISQYYIIMMTNNFAMSSLFELKYRV